MPEECGKAKLALHNAKQTFEALDKKHRKRTARINALQSELAQLEAAMPALTAKLEQSVADLKSAREAFRFIRSQQKRARRSLDAGRVRESR